MALSTHLSTAHEHRLDTPIHKSLISSNPRIELFAGASGPTTLQIWRSNGQVVAKNAQRGNRETVNALQWRPDGLFLAVGWSDGVVRLMGLEATKAIHQITVCESGKAEISCIAWTCNTGTKSAANSKHLSSNAWKQLEDLELDAVKSRSSLNLPRELAFLEVETSLPKLSPLPASGGSGDDMFVFTTRASLEFLFRPFRPEDSDNIDIMVVGTTDGRVHLSIYDSFVIGTFKYLLPQTQGLLGALQLCRHAAHPSMSTHMLVFQPAGEASQTQRYIVPMDLTFLSSSAEDLSLLASKTTTLQKLLRYVRQVQMHMMHEWQSTRELPSRFLNSINQTLSESEKYGNMSIGQALYHTVVTGHSFPEVREWLVDQLAERGHKRWDRAVTSGLQSLRSLVHENLLPALERVGIILSRLLGISRYHESRDDIGFSSTQITLVMEIVSALIQVGHKILLLTMDELDLFQTFSAWLRHEIDRLASSSVSDELSEKEATMEHGKILAYIDQYLSASPLRHYLQSVSADDSRMAREQLERGSAVSDLLAKDTQRQEVGQEPITVIPRLEFLCSYLDDKAKLVFQGLAEAKKRGVRFGQPTKIDLGQEISQCEISVTTSRQDNPGTTQAITYAAVTTEQEKNAVFMLRTTTTVVNGISSAVVPEAARIALGEGHIVDLKFLDENNLLILWDHKDSKRSPLRLIRFPYRAEDLGYVQYNEGVTVAPHSFTNEQVESLFSNILVPQPKEGEPLFVPAKMEVIPACSGRSQMPARVCLLSKNGEAYKVYTIPEGWLET
ncbi:anaphase-promoting complex, cyclosome, subunit 4-domain-containing protein [Microdochium trichocladiopsis]|uniref:Anaphase-promoting complex subunit 4 n=1 Tax=Microdochium trichocladiopsis TaxID=1682393 RepID=A0A9P8YF90_9PEZI|nr:anaphase-promoting complex, cyclosome, subunit 4-domain-containing protein [Microdochium trichocladiopsis]KAH7037837.1 anaphase-promoting complex, cyclosome, subunit 4-domain-containing protein [Microdochium trichocladiopsis]